MNEWPRETRGDHSHAIGREAKPRHTLEDPAGAPDPTEFILPAAESHSQSNTPESTGKERQCTADHPPTGGRLRDGDGR